ncbi:hypothetical protein NA56DRAFT_106412 [Hyaloscypha hepaticicola]|uniref:Uncharacterized protein n=1 Tax=Hyaloscypha hepaticicola TaxID=2082293 RepID=A0A2J6Q6M4_9HELO|nr:hypothetical protein NA56DRAFT_106412 [Hyaloscypha hepaticicola]
MCYLSVDTADLELTNASSRWLIGILRNCPHIRVRSTSEPSQTADFCSLSTARLFLFTAQSSTLRRAFPADRINLNAYFDYIL